VESCRGLRHEGASETQEASIARTPKASPPKTGDAETPRPKPAPKRAPAAATAKAAKPKAKPAAKAPKPKAKPAPKAPTVAEKKKAAAARPSTRVTATPKTRAAAKPSAAKPAAKAPAAPRPTRRTRPPKVAPDRLAQLVEAARKSLEDDKAEDVLVLDVTGRADYADRLIIATGLVDRQIQAMATHVVEALEQAGLRLRRDAVQASPDWVLIDALDLVIHLFKPDARALYGLERMWGPDSPPPESAA
jgi:ribosome silencing factor RsfS/YbeB/iojap